MINCLKVIGRLLVLAMPLLLNDFYLPLVPKESFKLNLILDILIYCFWQGSIFFLAYKAKWFDFPDLGIYFKNFLNQISWGLVLTVIAVLVSILIFILQILIHENTGIVLNNIWYYPPNPNWHAWQFALHAIYLALTAGVMEELIYRGAVISQLRKISNNTLFLVIASTILFVTIHWSLGIVTWIEAAVFGSFWAYLFIKTGRLIPIMIAHFLYNLLFIYGFQQYILGLLNCG